jgi:hypothetical protein
MPPKGIKRTNISNSSDNSSSSVCVDKKQTKKKSRKKSKIVLKNVNTGNNTGDISNVNKPSDTLQSPYLYNDLYTNMNSTNPTQFSQDTSFMYSQNSAPMLPMQNLCSTPNPNMMNTMNQPQMQHASPLNQPAQMQQRPAWVDDLFRKMDKVESKLNKLDKIDTLVTSLNSKVTKLEVTTKSSDGRIDQVEKSTQLMSDEFDKQKKQLTDFRSEIDKISKQLKSSKTSVDSVDKKVSDSIQVMKKENDKLKEELTDVKLKSMQNNLIFYNIDENEEENCPELIINFCDERLKIGNAATKISITDAFRLGKKSDKTRPILVKFASFENRDFVKKNAKNLKGSSYGISEQLPAEIMKIRKVKLPILKELRDRDVKAYFVKDKIFVGGKEYIP